MMILQIGLGSMGKRRVRNLQYLGIRDITGFDIKASRNAEANRLYDINTLSSFAEVNWYQISHVIISTPPDAHVEYALEALRRRKHVFIEASVVDDGYDELIALADKASVVLVPSCTMRFDPLNVKLKEILDRGDIGEMIYAQHHFGQYLPRWHPYESIHDFYVSKKSTGAAREIVPFDLVYLTWLLGSPTVVSAFQGKTGVLDAEIDDVYTLMLKTDRCQFVQICVDVVSQISYRTTRIVGKSGNVELDTAGGTLSIYDSITDSWKRYTRLGLSQTKSTEEMYVLEMGCFLKATQGKIVFPYDIRDDHKILKYLYLAEESNKSGKKVEV